VLSVEARSTTFWKSEPSRTFNPNGFDGDTVKIRRLKRLILPDEGLLDLLISYREVLY